MKKILSLILLSVMATSTFAASNCSITYNAAENLVAIIKENKFEFDNYDAVCQRLKNANAEVKFTDISAITDKQTVITVTVMLMDKDFPIPSTSYTTMVWDDERTTIKEKQLLMQSVNVALSNMDQSKIDNLNANRKKLGFKTYPAPTNSNKKY